MRHTLNTAKGLDWLQKDTFAAIAIVLVTTAVVYYLPEADVDVPGHFFVAAVAVLAGAAVILGRLVRALLKRRRQSRSMRSSRARSRRRDGVR